MPRSMCGTVVCSSLAAAIPFYRQLGFDEYKLAEKETSGPEQLFMKYKCGRPTVENTEMLVLDDVQVLSEDAKPGTCLGDLLEEVSASSLSVFQEDIVEVIRRKP